MLRGREQQLVDARERGERGDAERRRPDRHLAPARGLQPFRAARVLDSGAQPAFAEEAHRDPGALGAGDRRAQREEDAGAVAGHPVRRPRTAVPDRGEACERPIEQLP